MTFKCACDLIRHEYGTTPNFMTPEVLEYGWIVAGKIAYELSTGDFLDETLYAVSVVFADPTTEKGTRRAGTTDCVSAVFNSRENAHAHIERLRQDGCGSHGGAPINGGERAGKDNALASPVAKIDWDSYTKWYVERVLPLKQQDRAARALLFARLESCLEGFGGAFQEEDGEEKH